MALTVLNDEILGSVQSVCSTCLISIPATIIVSEGDVYLKKTCPIHGEEIVLESRGRDFYHVGASPCCQDSAHQGNSEPLGPSCVALIEITDACNLECPLCFAASGPKGGYFITLEEFKRRVEMLIERRGPIDILMISGGEPTVHPQLREILEYAVRLEAIGMVMLNTNGVAFTTSEELRTLVTNCRDRIEVYLQCDPISPDVAEQFRGSPNIVSRKLDALRWLNQSQICVTLAAALSKTVPLDAVRALLDLALEHPFVRGVTFQPAFASGRHKPAFNPNDRLTTPEAVALICGAYPEIFSRSGFTNLPCSHPNCAVVGYYYRASGKLWPLLEEIVPDSSLSNRINFSLEDLKRCGCDSTELGQYIRSAELSSEHSFRIVIKPFMDRFNLNRDRSSQCCTHVIGPLGKPMSFCEYNIFRKQLDWNRNS